MNELMTKYSGEVKTGDFIIVSYSNAMTLGFYLGRGQGGSMQYYALKYLCDWIDKLNDPIYRRLKPYKFYINCPHPNRVSKYSKELLNDELKIKYERAIEALTLLNIQST